MILLCGSAQKSYKERWILYYMSDALGFRYISESFLPCKKSTFLTNQVRQEIFY